MKASYGFIETRGFVAALTAADAMVKAAQVQLLRFRKVGGALVTITVKGDLAACQAAVEAGKKVAAQTGHLVSSHIIANPYPDTEEKIEGMRRGGGLGRRKKQTRQKTLSKSTSSETPQTRILRYLKKQKQGATLEELAGLLKKSPSEVRILIKQLMDQNKIEKIRRKYFLSS